MSLLEDQYPLDREMPVVSWLAESEYLAGHAAVAAWPPGAKEVPKSVFINARDIVSLSFARTEAIEFLREARRRLEESRQ